MFSIHIHIYINVLCGVPTHNGVHGKHAANLDTPACFRYSATIGMHESRNLEGCKPNIQV